MTTKNTTAYRMEQNKEESTPIQRDPCSTQNLTHKEVGYNAPQRNLCTESNRTKK